MNTTVTDLSQDLGKGQWLLRFRISPFSTDTARALSDSVNIHAGLINQYGPQDWALIGTTVDPARGDFVALLEVSGSVLGDIVTKIISVIGSLVNAVVSFVEAVLTGAGAAVAGVGSGVAGLAKGVGALPGQLGGSVQTVTTNVSKGLQYGLIGLGVAVAIVAVLYAREEFA